MPDDIHSLLKQYHAFYQVLPYYVELEEKRGDQVVSRRRIQAGFDVDVYGLSNKAKLDFPSPREYELGREELNKIAQTVAHHTADCAIEVLGSSSTVYFEARTHFQPEGRLRMRISHLGVEQPAGLSEEGALKEIEAQLQGLGVERR